MGDIHCKVGQGAGSAVYVVAVCPMLSTGQLLNRKPLSGTRQEAEVHTEPRSPTAQH